MPPFHRLETTEHTLLEKLLVGDHPLLEQLRKQAKLVVVRTRTPLAGVGISLELHVPRATHHLPGHETRDVELDDVGFQLQGAQEGGQAHVFVQGGFLARLEMYNWADDWPQQPVLEEEPFHLVSGNRTPAPSGQRDMRAVTRKLEPPTKV